VRVRASIGFFARYSAPSSLEARPLACLRAMVLLTALLLLAVTSSGCAEPESGLTETSFAAPDFTLNDGNEGSPHFGESRTLFDENKLILLYFASFG